MAMRLDQTSAWILATVIAAMVAIGFYLGTAKVVTTQTDHINAQSKGEGSESLGRLEPTPGKLQKWGYHGAIGPMFWADIDDQFEKCRAGKSQSPIDIGQWKFDRKLPRLKLGYRSTDLELTREGSLLVARLPKGAQRLSYAGMNLSLEKISFHAPSEHTIKGVHYDGEIQLLHYNSNRKLYILSVLIKGEPGAPSSEFLQVVNQAAQSQEGATWYGASPDLLLPENLQYFTYKGSLTYPPCVEGVTWLVLDEPLIWAKSDLRQIQQLLGRNVRPIQRKERVAIRMSP